ncbi:unnamed protein product [Lactuca virosa]|uniref:Uncharacterized protein n=1 Tax=Lactuca virosa TaxID=75947 RepID=A0AAU9PP67_9ASTR|nr:unnamed protein product [Lactuca virosa]
MAAEKSSSSAPTFKLISRSLIVCKYVINEAHLFLSTYRRPHSSFSPFNASFLHRSSSSSPFCCRRLEDANNSRRPPLHRIRSPVDHLPSHVAPIACFFLDHALPSIKDADVKAHESEDDDQAWRAEFGAIYQYHHY